MKKTKQLIILLMLVIIGGKGYGQTHQWAESFHTNCAWGYESSVSLDSNHNSYVVGNFKDTLRVGGKTLLSKSKNTSIPSTNYNIFLTKFNQSGTLSWCNSIYSKSASASGHALFISNIKVLTNKKILIYGWCGFNSSSGVTLMLSPTDSVVLIRKSTTQGIGFIATYDSSGKFTSYLKVYDGGNYNMNNGRMDIDKQRNIYITTYATTYAYLFSKKDSIYLGAGGNDDARIIKYSPNFDSIIWHQSLSTNVGSNYLRIMKMKVGEDNNLYITFLLRGGVTQTIGKQKFSLTKDLIKGMLSVLTPDGKFIYTGFVNQDLFQNDNVVDVVAIDTNRIYVMGYVQDSILRAGKWYSSPNPKSSGAIFPYIGLISISKTPKWIILAKDKDNSGPISDALHILFGYAGPGSLNFDKELNVYASFRSWKTKLISIGGLSDTNRTNYGFAKFDSVGNALWLRSAAFITDMKPDSTNVVYCGYYSGALTLKPHTLSSTFTTPGFIAKTYDYMIRRGNISRGPYCAGDTILVPYTMDGVYDSNNVFIAEISDENGRFDGKEKELGRLKTNKADTVIGILPLFKTVSSDKYRIRIRSTHPVVQSNYKADGLRLLIYSRDKADPGPDETICKGDSIELSTFGGTKWTWSPKYNMSDSSLRQTMAWPQKTTTYKIIIGDSSGCGAPDTAYKKIFVRQDLKAILGFTDTTLCENIQLKIPAHFVGGDSNYNWQWFFVNSPKSFFPLTSGKLKQDDTLNYNTSVAPGISEKIALVLWDGCSSKKDSVYLNIRLRKLVTIQTRFKDTTICNGNKTGFKAKATGGESGNYQWQWLDVTNVKALSNTDSFHFSGIQTTKIQLTVNDGCAALESKTTFTITVKAPLKLTTNLRDTTICEGQKINYSATALGGNSKAYKFNWLLNTKLIDTSSSLTFTSASTSTLTLILKDNCSIPNDTIKKTITIKPAPKADFSYGVACSRTNTDFRFNGTKPPSPITTTFLWNFNNESSSTLENPSHLFASAGTSASTLTLTSSNGCTNSITKNITIKPQSKADFTADDVCETDSAIFINKSQDATSYNWKFGDGLKSGIESPKHLYNIGGVSKTFNVSLVAIVSNGCSDSITKAISINANPKSDFSYTKSGKSFNFTPSQSGNSKYRWLYGDGDSSINGTSNHTYTDALNEHTVCLKTTNAAGCVSETCKLVSTVGISGISNLSGFKLYPNPNTGSFIIEIENPAKDVSIEVYNSLGEKVGRVEKVGKVNSIEMDLANGIYLVRVKNSAEVWNQKVMVSIKGTPNGK